jgi:RNase P subunit RPR2
MKIFNRLVKKTEVMFCKKCMSMLWDGKTVYSTRKNFREEYCSEQCIKLAKGLMLEKDIIKQEESVNNG